MCRLIIRQAADGRARAGRASEPGGGRAAVPRSGAALIKDMAEFGNAARSLYRTWRGGLPN